jgi:hypothetical protein
MLNKPKTFEAQLTNCQEKDATFLKDLVAIFSDPANRELLEHLRAGEVALQMHPETGALHMLPVTRLRPATAALRGGELRGPLQ